MPNAKTGQRFSHLYLERGVPTSDSQRFRNRVAAVFEDMTAKNAQVEESLKRAIRRELGIEVPVSRGRYDPSEVFRSGDLRDALDCITLATAAFAFADGANGAISRRTNLEANWIQTIRRILAEENVGYSLDDEGGVHYFVDQEFERARQSTLAVLSADKLSAARAAHEDAYRHLDRDPRDTKAAVRSVFECVEIISRLICKESKNLNGWLARNTLKDKCLAVASGDATEVSVLTHTFDSLADWVDGAHLYRHGQGVTDPIAPSDELAIYLISSGSNFARFLAGYYLRMPQAEEPELKATPKH